ncbi:MAG: hypothetical protein EA411_03580, partial [Saprospirales bacterium]
MKKVITKISTISLIFALPLFLGLNGLQAQCTNDWQWPTSAVNAPDDVGDVVTISTCIFADEYSHITNISSGDTYEFTSDISTDYLTIREGSSTGPVIASGVTPVEVITTSSDDLYVHVNSDSNCNSAGGCRTTTVECLTCGTGTAGYCNVGPTNADYSQLESASLIGESNDIDWFAGCPGQTGVIDATTDTADLNRGGTYDLDMVISNCTGTGSWDVISVVWVDWNQDFEFSSDEIIGDWDGQSTPAGTDASFQFTVPSDAQLGTTTMRILVWETSAYSVNDLDDPCDLPGLFTWGAVADFTVEVLDAAGVCELTECPPSLIQVGNDPGECGAFVNIDLPTLEGTACADVEITNTYNNDADASDFYPVGTTEVIITAEGLGDCNVTVTVVDEEPPLLDCPNDINISLGGGECNRIVEYNVSVTDNCPFEDAGSLWGYEGSTVSVNSLWYGSAFLLINETNDPIVIDNFTQPIPNVGTREYEIYVTNDDHANYGGFLDVNWDLVSIETVTSTVAGDVNDLDTYTEIPVPAGALIIPPNETRGIIIWDNSPTSGGWMYSSLHFAGIANDFQTDGNLSMDLSDGCAITTAGPIDCSWGPPRGFVGEVFYSIGGGGDVVQTDGLPSGSTFEVGTVTNCFETEDGAGNLSTCCFNVTINDFPNPITSLACNDHVNISVDDNCSVNLNADMFLEGGPYKCYDDYILEFTDSDGNVVDLEDLFLPDYIDQQFIYSVTDPETGNKCWGTVLFEDKLDPVIECRDITVLCGEDIPEEPAPAFDNEPFSIAFTGLNDEFGNVAFGPAPEEIEYEFDFSDLDDDFTIADVKLRVDMEMLRPHNNSIILESPDGTTQTIYNATTFNAGTFTFDVTFDDQGEVITAYDQLIQFTEGAPLQPINGTIAAGAGPVFFNFAGESAQGVWTVRFETTFLSAFTAAGGEISEVELILEVDADRVDPSDNCSLADVTFDDNVINFGDCDEVIQEIQRTWTAIDASGNSSSCVQTIEVLRTGLDELTLPDDITLNCTQNFAVDNQGHPHPSVTGEPGGKCPNVLTTYTDIVINDCPGEFKILRNWRLVDWCTDESRTVTQVIKIDNNTTPEIECLPAVTVSTEFNACEGTWDATLESLFATGAIDALPEDACSDDVNYTVSSTGGNVDNINDNWIISGIPVGTHLVIYSANDGCGNTAECVTQLTVVDDVAPVAICDLDTRVSLGGGTQGFARVFVDAFDDGSWDNCGVESILVRRSRDDNNFSKNSQCGNSRTEWQEFMDFCCEDIEARDGEVDIYVQVTDLSG